MEKKSFPSPCLLPFTSTPSVVLHFHFPLVVVMRVTDSAATEQSFSSMIRQSSHELTKKEHLPIVQYGGKSSLIPEAYNSYSSPSIPQPPHLSPNGFDLRGPV